MKKIIIGMYELPGFSKPNANKVLIDWEWIVLAECDGRALLISRDIVDWEFYSGENRMTEPAKPTTWEKSYMREHLEGFYENCFDAAEKRRILNGTNGDHLFLLTADEVRKFMPTEESRRARIKWCDNSCSDYDWWLNTVGAEDNMMQVVDEHGRIDEYGIHNDADEVGVRPAMYIRLPYMPAARAVKKTDLLGLFTDNRKKCMEPGVILIGQRNEGAGSRTLEPFSDGRKKRIAPLRIRVNRRRDGWEDNLRAILER